MRLQDAQVAVLVEHQFQELELWYPVLRLREAGARVLIVGPSHEQVYGSKIGYPVVADLAIDAVKPEDFDAVVIPGGFAPEGLRKNPAIVKFVRDMHDRGALVAAICHAGWMLASAGIARDRRLTCVALIKDDVINAGGKYVDEPVVRDGNLITSRLPGDLQDFGREIVAYLQENEGKRDASRPLLSPAGGRAFSSAAYKQAAHAVMAPRGKASANYMMTARYGAAG